MTETCPLRAKHTSRLTPMQRASGYLLITCPCGLTAAVKQNVGSN